jgi:hypothetical protein
MAVHIWPHLHAITVGASDRGFCDTRRKRVIQGVPAPDGTVGLAMVVAVTDLNNARNGTFLECATGHPSIGPECGTAFGN